MRPAAPDGSDSPAGPAAAPRTHAVRLVEIAETSGLLFRHRHGGAGAKYMIETMGSGGGVLDFDGDGLEDLYLVQAGDLPGRGSGGSRNVLFRNEGGGRFRDVTAEAHAGGRGYGMGFCSGDLDNDGDADIYVSAFGRNHLLLNRGDGRFEDATDAAGVGDERWGASCALADVDRDGGLDLYVTNYVDYALERNKPCGNPAHGLLSYCHPDVYDGISGVFYRNNLDGTFTDLTRASGFDQPEGKGLGAVFVDDDEDGDVDLYVANDSVPNFHFRNDGTGRFTEEGLFTGTAYNDKGETQAGMGVDAGDVDADGDIDLFVTNLDMETNTLYRQRGDGTYDDDTFPAGLGEPSLLFVGFGTLFVDVDHDGDLDIFVANGHILDNIERYNPSVTYAEPAHLYVNDGEGRFREMGRSFGGFFEGRQVARGLASLDMDLDGDLDLLVTCNNDRARLLRNDGGSAAGHWLQLRLAGRVSNRDGIGARIVARAGGVARVREVRAGSSYLSQSSLRPHWGLGPSAEVESLEIRWPSGRRQSLGPLPADRLYIVDEERGIVGP